MLEEFVDSSRDFALGIYTQELPEPVLMAHSIT